MLRRLAWMAIVALFAASALAVPAREQRIASALTSARLKVDEALTTATPTGTVAKAIVSFPYVDPAGKMQTGKGKVYLPAAVLADPSRKAPLAYSAGYELPDEGAKAYLKDGFVVATPINDKLNPMSRLPNLDAALLKSMRALPCVDDAKVIIFGGSAGGYTTLMLAAETFPLAAALPTVPPIDWGYNVQYFLANRERIKGPGGILALSPVPGLAGVSEMLLPQRTAYYPEDIEDRAWRLNSPIAQLDTITCPVLALFSTGDMLVPIYQVSRELVRPLDPAKFPSGFEADPLKLTKNVSERPSLLEKLGKENYKLTIIPADHKWPEATVEARKALKKAQRIAKRQGKPDPTPTLKMPLKGDKNWDVVVIDEGPITPKAGHFRYMVLPNSDDYVKNQLTKPLAPDQLTPKKLERLMTRYQGVEWLDSGLRRLDSPEAERADVLRGLITYVRQGEAHARRFAELYAALPEDRRALGPADRFSKPGETAAVLIALDKKL